MAKKKSSNSTPANKYGLSNLNFGRPGFSLEAPRASLAPEEKKEVSTAKKAGAKKTSKKETNTPEKNSTTEKVNPGNQGQKFNKAARVVSKPAIRRAAGRGK